MGHRYPPPTRFKIHHSYSVQEIATTGGVCENTVHNWRKAGLQAIDDSRPIYVTGIELRRFLTEMRRRTKSPCQIDELYCLKCRKPRRPDGDMADFLNTGSTGRLTGLCPVCTLLMHKRVSLQSLPLLEQKLQIQHLPPSSAATAPRAYKGKFLPPPEL